MQKPQRSFYYCGFCDSTTTTRSGYTTSVDNNEEER
jgi:hypothetical protein